MKKFIRPILFAVARLGLFCAVVTWIAAQSVAWLLCIPWGAREITFEVRPQGYALFVADPLPAFIGLTPLELESYAVDDISGGDGDELYAEVFGEVRQGGFVEHTFNAAGVVLGRSHSVASFVSVRHWTVVVTFVLCCSGLHWKSRRRASKSETMSIAQQDP